MSEQRVALEALHHGRDAVVPAHAQVVPLGDVVGQHHLRVAAHPAQHREQHVPLERLRLVHDHPRIVQRAAADVRQRQDLQHPAVHHLVHHGRGDERAQGVEHGLRPRAHLVALGAGQVAQVLAADGVQRAEHDHPAVLAALHHGVEARAQRQRGLAGARAAAEGDDAHARIRQQLDGQPLLGGAAVQAEHVAVPAHQAGSAALADPGQSGAPGRGEHQPRVDRQAVRLGRGLLRPGLDARAGQGPQRDAGQVDLAVVVEGVQPLLRHAEGDGAAPARVTHELVAVLVRGEAHGRRLHAHRQVLGHDRDRGALVRERLRDGEDAGVVVRAADAQGQHVHGHVVQFDPQRAALGGDRHGLVQRAVAAAQVVEQAQGRARVVAEVGVGALGLELRDHHERQDHLVLGEVQQGARVREQHGRVHHVGPQAGRLRRPRLGTRLARPARRLLPGLRVLHELCHHVCLLCR